MPVLGIVAVPKNSDVVIYSSGDVDPPIARQLYKAANANLSVFVSHVIASFKEIPSFSNSEIVYFCIP